MYQASMHTRNWIGPGYLLINLESLSVLQTGILFSQGSVWLFLEHLCMIDLLTARSSNNLPDDNFSASGDILEFLGRELLSGVIELYRVNLIVSSLIISRKTDRLLSVFRRVRVNKTKVAALKKLPINSTSRPRPRYSLSVRTPLRILFQNVTRPWYNTRQKPDIWWRRNGALPFPFCSGIAPLGRGSVGLICELWFMIL